MVLVRYHVSQKGVETSKSSNLALFSQIASHQSLLWLKIILLDKTHQAGVSLCLFFFVTWSDIQPARLLLTPCNLCFYTLNLIWLLLWLCPKLSRECLTIILLDGGCWLEKAVWKRWRFWQCLLLFCNLFLFSYLFSSSLISQFFFWCSKRVF